MQLLLWWIEQSADCLELLLLLELFKQHGGHSPRGQRPGRGRTHHPGPDDRDLNPLHGRDNSRPPPAPSRLRSEGP